MAAAKAGTLYTLESVSDYVKLASNSVTHVIDWDVTAEGLTASDILFGNEKEETKANDVARLRPLAPGDTIRTDQLASGGDTGPAAAPRSASSPGGSCTIR